MCIRDRAHIAVHLTAERQAQSWVRNQFAEGGDDLVVLLMHLAGGHSPLHRAPLSSRASGTGALFLLL